MIIWRGWGISVFLLFLFWFAVVLVLPRNFVMLQGLVKEDAAFQWALGVTCLLDAASVLLLDRYRQSHPRKIVDAQSGAEVLVPRVDELAFIRMEWCSYALFAGAAVLMVSALLGLVFAH
jgi:hypothetical protein